MGEVDQAGIQIVLPEVRHDNQAGGAAMITTDARISGIDTERQRYYDYLNTIYREISEYLKVQDGVINAEKLQLMFDKTASPFVYWLESKSREEAKKEMGDEKRMTLLKALEAKYNLRASEDRNRFFITSRLENDDFRRLSDNMKLVGFHYDAKERAFVRSVE